MTAFYLKPFTLQLYLHTGIGAATFGAIRPAHPDTLMQVAHAIEALPPQVAPMRWVTSMANKVDYITA